VRLGVAERLGQVLLDRVLHPAGADRVRARHPVDESGGEDGYVAWRALLRVGCLRDMGRVAAAAAELGGGASLLGRVAARECVALFSGAAPARLSLSSSPLPSPLLSSLLACVAVRVCPQGLAPRCVPALHRQFISSCVLREGAQSRVDARGLACAHAVSRSLSLSRFSSPLFCPLPLPPSLVSFLPLLWGWECRMDLMGTCDAFCDIAWNGQERKTKIVKNSYSPDWDETFTFVLEDVAAVGDLTLLVLDFDRLTDPDQVGKVVCARLRRVLQLQASAQVKAGKQASMQASTWCRGVMPPKAFCRSCRRQPSTHPRALASARRVGSVCACECWRSLRSASTRGR